MNMTYSNAPANMAAWFDQAGRGYINPEWAGLSEASIDNSPVLNALIGMGVPVALPVGSFAMSSPLVLTDDSMVHGIKGRSRLVFDGCEAITTKAAERSISINRIDIRDFVIEQKDGWGSNARTACDFTNVSYSLVRDVEMRYHKYGVYMRRTSASAQCYFNSFEGVKTFGAQYGFTAADNGWTPNKHTFVRCISEDNGQRSGGYGMDLAGVGHRVDDYYAGLPNHIAAVRMRLTCAKLHMTLLYAESPALAHAIIDESQDRENLVEMVHNDGNDENGAIVITSPSTNRTTYRSSGRATNMFRETKVVISKSFTDPVGGRAYDYLDFSIPGVAPGDTAKVIPPDVLWPDSLIRGEPIVISGIVRLPYVNGLPETVVKPPTGSYTIFWQDRTL